MIEFCTKLNCLRPPNYWSYIGLVPNVYGDLEALQSKILELFFYFLEGWGPWGTIVGVSGLEKSRLKFLLNASYSGWAFSSNLGL